MQRFAATLAARRELCDDVVELWLAPDADASPVSFVPGQHVCLTVDGVPDPCFFSLARPPRSSGELVICVKRDGGVCAEQLAGRRVGDRVEVAGPTGQLVLAREPGDAARDCLLVATGSGITPFRAMAAQLEQRAAAGTSAVLLYGARDLAGLIYHDSWLALAERYETFSYIPTVSRAVPSGGVCQRGRVTEHLSRAFAALARPSEALALLCGVAGMIVDVRADLEALGFNGARIRTEY